MRERQVDNVFRIARALVRPIHETSSGSRESCDWRPCLLRSSRSAMLLRGLPPPFTKTNSESRAGGRSRGGARARDRRAALGEPSLPSCARPGSPRRRRRDRPRPTQCRCTSLVRAAVKMVNSSALALTRCRARNSLHERRQGAIGHAPDDASPCASPAARRGAPRAPRDWCR